MSQSQAIEVVVSDKKENYKNIKTMLYYIKIYDNDNDNIYYKLGITTHNIELRFREELNTNLKIDILMTEWFDDGIEAYNKTRDIFKKYKNYQYSGSNILQSGNSGLFLENILNIEEADKKIDYWQMDAKEIKPLRENILEHNNKICPICKNEIVTGDACVDHCHESGFIRDVVCSACNVAEGMFKSKWKRSGASKKISYEKFIENMANHLNYPQTLILHPSNKPGPKKLMKSSYNQLIREIKKVNIYYKQKKKKPIKYPEYPKSKRLTKRLKELFEEFAIDPKYYIKNPPKPKSKGKNK